MKDVSQKQGSMNDIGVIFVSPIVGLTTSLMDSFKPLIDRGVSVIGVDIFGEDYEKKTFWKIVKLTILPGAHSRRISFANSFPEHKIFDKIEDATRTLVDQGKNKIVLGGMSGGFVFAARVAQSPPDHEIRNHTVQELKHRIVGLFGISPLLFYPQGVHRPDVKLHQIPSRVQTILFFGNNDSFLPPGTIKHAKEATKMNKHIQVKTLIQKEFGNKSKPVRHQFFGGEDFVGPLKNMFWHPEAEALVLDKMYTFLQKITSLNKT